VIIFADNSVANCWTLVTTGSATASEASGRATITLPSSVAGNHEAAFVSKSTYSPVGGSWYININGMVATGVAATAYYDLRLDNNNYLRWRQVSNVITARKVVGGVDTQLFTAAWSAATYKYLRISESGGTITFWSSTDGVTWTSRATIVGLPFAVGDLFVWMGALCGNVASPGAFTIEDVNLILPALTTNWRWQQCVWPVSFRSMTNTIAIDTAGTAQGYIATADGIDANGDPSGNVRYFSGPANGGRALTEQTTQAAAQAMAVDLPLNGRLDLPTMVEARCFRLYDRSIDGSAFTLREFYPRRLVEADDIRAESITALHIATIDLDAQHRVTAGGGIVNLDDTGLSMIARSIDASLWSPSTPSVRWLLSGTNIGAVEAFNDSVGATDILLLQTNLARQSQINIVGRDAIVLANNAGGSSAPLLIIQRSDQSINLGGITGTTKVVIPGGLNLGTATGAGAGQLISSGVVALHGALLDANIGLGVKGSGITTATRGLRVADSAGNVSLDVFDDGSIATRAGVRHNFGAYTAQTGLTIVGYVTDTVAGAVRRLAVV
jgi:hypothetical protein